MSAAGAMNCLAFERLLDEGAPHRLSAPALAHAGECARCERSLARARSLERALERQFTSEPLPADNVPAGFTDRVLARVERGEARGVRGRALPDALPWWVRAAADPAVLLASAVAALVLWRGERLLEAARGWFPVATQATHDGLAAASHAIGLDGFARSLMEALTPGAGAAWATSTALLVGVLPVLALVAIASWGAGERIGEIAGGLSRSSLRLRLRV
jgi:hypothetical protein